ncbi:MAG: biotin transporter BioY [Clostridia bacterium]|nr:biotin transporter BioY [Clostridia bacterium]
MTERTQTLVHIALMTAITAALSFVRIPFFPVPFTLQTLAAMLAGILLKRWAGVSSQVLYLLLGLSGLPLFSQGGGIAYIFNPTFGYLLFLPALTLLVSMFHNKFKVAGIVVPAIMLLAFGAFYYIALFRIPFAEIGKTLLGFMVVFIPAELLKAFCAYFVGVKIKSRLIIQK